MGVQAGPGPLAALPELPDAWPAGMTPVVAAEYGRSVAGAPVRALAFDPRGDLLLAFDVQGGLRRRAGQGAWRVLPAPLPPGVERIEAAGPVLLACSGDHQVARWSRDSGAHFADAGFTCGEGGRRTATLVDGKVYVLLGPESLGIGPVGGGSLEVRPLPAPGQALAVLPPRILVFGSEVGPPGGSSLGPGYAWRSEDDGQTFAPAEWPVDGPAVREAHFLAKAHVVAVGDAPPERGGAGLAVSLDGGRRFETPDLPRHTEHLASLASLDARVVAVPDGAGEAVASEDDAATFDLLPGGLAPRDTVVAVHDGFVAGAADRGVVGFGGVTVAPLDVTPLRAAVFPHPRVGFGVDAAGRVRISRDGGSSWPTLTTPGLVATGLARLDADYGLVLGTDRGLFRYDGRTQALRPLDPTCGAATILPIGSTRLQAAPSAVARCDDGGWRWLHDFGSERLEPPGVEVRAVASGDGGRPAALSADGHTLLQLDAASVWHSRAVPAAAAAIDLGGTTDGLTLLFADGQRGTLTRFEGAFHRRPGGLGPGVQALGLVPLPGGAALVSSDQDVLHVDAIGQWRTLAAAPGALGLVPTGDGAWLVLQSQASTLLFPR